MRHICLPVVHKSGNKNKTPQTMKVFTVGMDEKPPLKEGETKLSMDQPLQPMVPMPTPLVAIEARGSRRRSGGLRALAVALFTLFCLLFLGIVISELAYNRARDENYMRLRWAELKHRLGYGYDPMERLAMQLQSDSFIKPVAVHLVQQQQLPLPIVPLPEPAVTTAEPKNENKPEKEEKVQLEPRLNFLRTLLETIRDHASRNGLDGTMEVSVVQVDPVQQVRHSILDGGRVQHGPFPWSQAIQDGFGETHMPNQPVMFGPWQTSDDYNNNEDNNEFNGPPNHSNGNNEMQLINIRPPPPQFASSNGMMMRPMWMNNIDEESSNEQQQQDGRPPIRIIHGFGIQRPPCGNCLPPWLRPPQQQQQQQQPNPGDRFRNLLQDLIARRLGTVIGGINGIQIDEPQQQQQQNMMPVMSEIPMVHSNIRPIILDNFDQRMHPAIQIQTAPQFQEPWMQQQQQQPWNNNNEIETNNVEPSNSIQFPRPIVITHMQQQQQQQPVPIGMGATDMNANIGQPIQVIHQQEQPMVIIQPQQQQESPKVESFFNNINVAKEWPTEEWKPWGQPMVNEVPQQQQNNNFWQTQPVIETSGPSNEQPEQQQQQQPIDEQHSALHLLPLRELQAPPPPPPVVDEQAMVDQPQPEHVQPVIADEISHPVDGQPIDGSVVVTQNVPVMVEVSSTQPENSQNPTGSVVDNESPHVNTVNFPPVKFPVDNEPQHQHLPVEEATQHDEVVLHHDEANASPLFLQVDEPQPQEVAAAADPPAIAAQ